MQTLVQLHNYTAEEYLAQEEVSEFRNEYRDGAIVPMTGGSINHNRIVGSIHAWLKFALRGKNAEPFFSDLRVWIPHYRQYTYPDVMVIQGEPVFQDQRQDIVMNPVLIIEVLSRSTQNHDRTEKFKYYRSIPEFQEYVLINQYQVEIEQYTKTTEGWLFREYGPDVERVKLSSLNLVMSIKDLYEGVNFESEVGEPSAESL
jgi:Uma2 family endonuclease